MGQNVDIGIPIPFYNFVSIFVTAAVMIWAFRAIKRFARALSIRAAALSDSLIMIRGLGHNLMYFDGASQMHMDSLAHTRQSKPPSLMKVGYVPFDVRDLKLNGSTSTFSSSSSSDRFSIQADIWLATRSYVFAVSDFHLDNFKTKFEELYAENSGRTRLALPDWSRNPALHACLEALNPSHQLSSHSPVVSNKLALRGIIQAAGSVVDLPAGLHQRTTFHLASPPARGFCKVALFVIPAERQSIEHADSKQSHSAFASMEAGEEATNTLHDPERGSLAGSVRTGSLGRLEAGNVMSLLSVDLGVLALDVEAVGEAGASSSSSSSSSSSRHLSHSDTLVCMEGGAVYTINEIFGLKATAPSSSVVSQSQSSSSSSSAPDRVGEGVSAVEGGSDEDDCVVCLTDPKAVVLLPCRHLCVCGGCLQFIDKCPVCRSTFNEYFILQSRRAAALQIPAMCMPCPPTSSLRTRGGDGSSIDARGGAGVGAGAAGTGIAVDGDDPAPMVVDSSLTRLL